MTISVRALVKISEMSNRMDAWEKSLKKGEWTPEAHEKMRQEIMKEMGLKDK